MTKEQFIEQLTHEQEPLRRFLRVLCGGDRSRADDIAQEAMLKAYLSFERFEGRARFSTWLFRIAYNCFYDNMQKVSMAAGEPLPEEQASASQDGKPEIRYGYIDESEPADKKFRYQQLYLAINALSQNEKEIVVLFYMEEKSIKEIEVITGMPSGTIRSHLSRARGHLRSFLSSKM